MLFWVFLVLVLSFRAFLPFPHAKQALMAAHPLLLLVLYGGFRYWGHSGAPLFNSAGEVVGIHNAWNPSNAARHAVSHEAIVKFVEATCSTL
jgi:hypothetical protein